MAQPVSYTIMAPELNDRMLADFLDMESSLIVNLSTVPGSGKGH